MIKRRASPARYLARCVDFGTTIFTKHIRDVTSESSQATRLHWDFGHQEMACNAKKKVLLRVMPVAIICMLPERCRKNHIQSKTRYSDEASLPTFRQGYRARDEVDEWGKRKERRDMMEKENILLDLSRPRRCRHLLLIKEKQYYSFFCLYNPAMMSGSRES